MRKRQIFCDKWTLLKSPDIYKCPKNKKKLCSENFQLLENHDCIIFFMQRKKEKNTKKQKSVGKLQNGHL
jgi:hypothetical protein